MWKSRVNVKRGHDLTGRPRKTLLDKSQTVSKGNVLPGVANWKDSELCISRTKGRRGGQCTSSLREK